MNNTGSKKRKGYGAQSAIERKNRRKAFKLNSKERDVVESTSCLLSVPGPKEKLIRWKKDDGRQRNLDASTESNKSTPMDHISKRHNDLDPIVGRTKSTRMNHSQVHNKVVDTNDESTSSSQIPSPVYSGKNPKRPLPTKKLLTSIQDENSFEFDDLDDNDTSQADREKCDEGSNVSLIESFTSDDSTKELYRKSIVQSMKGSKAYSKLNNEVNDSLRSNDSRSDDHSSFLTDCSTTPNILEPPGLKRISNWRNKKGDKHKAMNATTSQTMFSTQRTSMTQNDHVNESFINESVNSAYTTESEFRLAPKRTPHKRHDIIEESFADESEHNTEFESQSVSESRLFSGLSTEIEQQRENGSLPNMLNTPQNLNSSKYQLCERLFVEALKKMVDICIEYLDSDGKPLSTMLQESSFIIFEQSIVQGFQELIQIKEEILSTSDHQITLTNFHQSFENAVKKCGVNNIVPALMKSLKFMLRREVSIITVSSFCHCIRFFLNTISYDDFYFRLDGTNACSTTLLSNTMLRTILNTDVIICVLEIIPFCVDFIRKKNHDEIFNYRESISSALFCIQEALGCLHALDLEKFSMLLIHKGHKRTKRLWDSFLKMFRTATLMPTYASFEVLLLLLFRIRLKILEIANGALDDDDKFEGVKISLDKLNNTLQDIFHGNCCPCSIILAKSTGSILIHDKDKIKSVDAHVCKSENICNFVEWVRQSFEKIQQSPGTFICSFQCNGIYTPSSDGKLGTRLAHGEIPCIDVNITTLSFFVSPPSQRVSRNSDNSKVEWFNHGRHVIDVHFDNLTDVTYSHYDCAVSLSLLAEDWEMSSLRFLDTNYRSRSDRDSTAEKSNKQSINSLWSKSKTSPCSNSSNEKKSIRIFVKRTEFRSFVDTLVSRGVAITAEDDPDGGNSTVSFQCVPPVESVRRKGVVDSLCLEKTTQMELNTKYGLEDPQKIISLINQASSTMENASHGSNSIRQEHCDKHHDLKSVGSKIDTSRQNKVTTVRSMDSIRDSHEKHELHSSQIVTPLKISGNRLVFDSCDNVQTSLNQVNGHDQTNECNDVQVIERKKKQSKMVAAKISPFVLNNKYSDSQNDSTKKSTFEGTERANLSSVPGKSSLQKMSALWQVVCPLNQDCSLDQSKKLSNLMSENNAEGDLLANTVIQIDETISIAYDVMQKLKHELMLLHNFSEADNLLKSLSWIESAVSMTLSGSNAWKNQKNRVEEKMVDTLLNSLTPK